MPRGSEGAKPGGITQGNLVAVVVVARGIWEGEEGRVVLGNREVVGMCLQFLEENRVEVVAGWQNTTMIKVLHENVSSAKIEDLTGVRLTHAPRRGAIVGIFFLFLSRPGEGLLA